MPFTNTLASLVDESYRSKSFHEIAASPPGALGGLTHTDAAKVMDALDVSTIGELATSKYVLWAQSITHLAQYEKIVASAGPAFNPSLAAILDGKWEKMPLRDLIKAPPSIFTGLSEREATLLAEGLQVKTVEDLATNRFVLVAQVIAHLAKYEKASDEPVRQAA